MRQEAFTTGQVAKWCGVNFRTVLRWIARGELKAFQLPGGGHHRILTADVADFLRRHNLPLPEVLQKRKPRVLVVEGHSPTARMIAQALRPHYETRVARDSFSAGAQFAAFVPDVLLLEFKMPGLEGLRVIELIRGMKDFRKVKILVVSTLTSHEALRATRAGADDFLSKPFQADALQKKVAELLGLRD